MIVSTSQAELPGIVARRVLFSGALSAIAVIAGWLVYFSFLAGIGALIAALVGATIAAVIHAVQHYFHVARHEATGPAHNEHRHAAENGHSTVPRRPSFAAAAQAGAIILGFVGIVSVHVVTELTHELLIPCLVSIVTLVPIGMLLGAIFSSPKPGEVNFPMIAFGIPIGGGLIGLGAASVAYAAQWAMGQHPEFWPIAGWWVLVGVGLFAAARGRLLNVRRSVIGVGLALMIVLASAWTSRPKTASSPSSQPAFDDPPTSAGVFSLWLLILRSRDDAIRAPDIPSHVWDEALAHARREWVEARIRHGEMEVEQDAGPRRSAWGSTLARWCGCPDQTVAAPSDEATIKNSEPATTQPIDHTPGYIAMYPDEAPRLTYYFDFTKFHVEPWDGGRVVCRQLRMGLESGLVRSWLVMLLFSMGLGLAPRVEFALRPSDYPSSRTRRMDGLMWLAVCTLIFGGILVLRSSSGQGHDAAAKHNDAPNRTFSCVAKIDCGGPTDMVESARAWKVARNEYVNRTCDEFAAAGFNILWLDNLDYQLLPVWMSAAASHGVRVVAPEFDSTTSIFGGPSFSPSLLSGTGGLGPFLSSQTLAGFWLGTTEGPKGRNLEVLQAAAESRRSNQPNLLTVVEFSNVTNVASGAKAIRPNCIAWREPRFRGDDGDHAIRDHRPAARAAAEAIGARAWVIVDGDEVLRASDYTTTLAGRATPPLDPAVFRLQINSAILDGAAGVGMSFRLHPPQPPRERPSLLKPNLAPYVPISVGRETPSESILEAGRTFRRLRSLDSLLGNLTLGETHPPDGHTVDAHVAPHAHGSADSGVLHASVVSIGKLQIRTFDDHRTRRRYALMLNTDVAEWQHAALPTDEAAESWINVESGQAWQRRDFQKLILNPGGTLLLRTSLQRPES